MGLTPEEFFKATTTPKQPFRVISSPSQGINQGIEQGKEIFGLNEKKDGFLKSVFKEEVEQTGERFEKTFSEQEGVVGKTAAVATLPLRSAGALAKIGGRIIAEPIAGLISGAANILSENKLVQDFAESKTGEAISTKAEETISNIGKALSQLEGKIDPELAQSLKDTAELALWATGVKPVTSATKTVLRRTLITTEKALRATANIPKTTFNIAKGTSKDIILNIGKRFYGKDGEKIVNSLKESYSKIPLPKNLMRAEAEEGKSFAQFMAEKPHFTIKTKNMKYDTFSTAQTIKQEGGVEARALDELLKEEVAMTSFDEMEKVIEKEIEKFFQGTEREKALNFVRNEISALERQNPSDLVDLSVVNNKKQLFWDRSPFIPTASRADRLASSVDYRMGTALQKLIESKATLADVKALNQQIGDYYHSAQVLENLHGGAAPRGRIGIDFARISGTIIGSPGGFVGSVVGYLSAGRIAEIIANPEITTAMKRYLVKELIIERPSVAKQVEEILIREGMEREARLFLPEAPIITPFPKGTPITKLEIEKFVKEIEAQTTRNEMQKVLNEQAKRFKSEEMFLKSVRDNPAWLKKFEDAGTTPESVAGFTFGNISKKKDFRPSIGLTIEDVSKSSFKGLPNLSTKLLEQFRGLPEKIKSGRFEEIINKAKKTGIKQVDENILRSSIIKDIQGNIDLPKTAAKVEEKLVPLKPTPVKTPRWSNIGEEFIGDGKYREIVYQSPIKTSAGNIHFSSEEMPNYFSHVRYEDMADGKTRKILETQSDLMQKENFEREFVKPSQFKPVAGGGKSRVLTEAQKNIDEEVKLLQPYSSNDPLAHLRTFREEVKRAAKDGKDTLLIPSGETAMKIEGLGSRETFQLPNGRLMTPETMKIGEKIIRAEDSNAWIITDVLGEGKFKAVPKERTRGLSFERWRKEFPNEYNNLQETFDISGKVDTKHFVYKLNEEAIPREARKMGLEVEGKIKQDNGEWWKIKIPKQRAGMPVEAFSIAGLTIGLSED